MSRSALRPKLFVARSASLLASIFGYPPGSAMAFKAATVGSRPSLMSLLLGLVQPIDESCKNLDEEMVATKAKGRGLLRHARGCTPEFVDEDGATRRDSGLHRLDEDVDAPAIERRKPACLHQGPLSVNDTTSLDEHREQSGGNPQGTSGVTMRNLFGAV